MKLEIMRFEVRHAAAAAELEQICFSEPWSAGQIAAAGESELYRMYSAECDGEFAGYCGFQYIPDEGYVTNVAVFPRFRGLGVGEALVDYMCRRGEEMGLEFLTLEVRVSNTPAQRLYTKLGFEPVGCRRNFYCEPLEDALLMTKYFKR